MFTLVQNEGFEMTLGLFIDIISVTPIELWVQVRNSTVRLLVIILINYTVFHDKIYMF